MQYELLIIIVALALALVWLWTAARPPGTHDSETNADFDEYIPPPAY